MCKKHENGGTIAEFDHERRKFQAEASQPDPGRHSLPRSNALSGPSSLQQSPRRASAGQMGCIQLKLEKKD